MIESFREKGMEGGRDWYKLINVSGGVSVSVGSLKVNGIYLAITEEINQGGKQ